VNREAVDKTRGGHYAPGVAGGRPPAGSERKLVPSIRLTAMVLRRFSGAPASDLQWRSAIDAGHIRAFLECRARDYLEEHPALPISPFVAASPTACCICGCGVIARCPDGQAYVRLTRAAGAGLHAHPHIT